MNDTALLSAIDRAMRELQVIREAVASRPAPKVALLKALAEANGDSLFVAADVVSPPLTTSVPSLAAALDQCGARNARALGQLLSSLEGQEFGGLSVLRAGTDRAGILWQVVAVPSVR